MVSPIPPMRPSMIPTGNPGTGPRTTIGGNGAGGSGGGNIIVIASGDSRWSDRDLLHGPKAIPQPPPPIPFALNPRFTELEHQPRRHRALLARLVFILAVVVILKECTHGP